MKSVIHPTIAVDDDVEMDESEDELVDGGEKNEPLLPSEDLDDESVDGDKDEY